MARNKDLPSKLRRASSMKKNRSVPNWVIQRTAGGETKYINLIKINLNENG